MDKYDVLKLENQLCFPLYAVSKEIVRKYKPFLDEIDLTYYAHHLNPNELYSVKEIDGWAFQQSYYLSEVSIPDTVEKIGNGICYFF